MVISFSTGEATEASEGEITCPETQPARDRCKRKQAHGDSKVSLSVLALSHYYVLFSSWKRTRSEENA